MSHLCLIESKVCESSFLGEIDGLLHGVHSQNGLKHYAIELHCYAKKTNIFEFEKVKTKIIIHVLIRHFFGRFEFAPPSYEIVPSVNLNCFTVYILTIKTRLIYP